MAAVITRKIIARRTIMLWAAGISIPAAIFNNAFSVFAYTHPSRSQEPLAVASNEDRARKSSRGERDSYNEGISALKENNPAIAKLCFKAASVDPKLARDSWRDYCSACYDIFKAESTSKLPHDVQNVEEWKDGLQHFRALLSVKDDRRLRSTIDDDLQTLKKLSRS